MTTTQDAMRDRYRSLALDWIAEANDSKKANRTFKMLQAYYKEIRELSDGRRAIAELLQDPNPAIRGLAATHCLSFLPEEAVTVLEQLESGTGASAMDAKYTLINYRSGKLNVDW